MDDEMPHEFLFVRRNKRNFRDLKYRVKEIFAQRIKKTVDISS